MGAFADSIKKNAELIQKQIDQQLTKLAIDTFKDVILLSPSDWKDSPYAEGLLVNQWYPQVNGFSNEFSNSKDKSGYQSFARLAELVDSKIFYKKDASVSLTNNTSYAYRAEVLGWNPTPEYPKWKGAAPYGMVSKALTKAKDKL